MIKQRFEIIGMHCTGCVMAVEGAIEDLSGVKSANANYAKQHADVEYDDTKVSVDAILAAVAEAGYEAQLRS
jgi:copper ion binding protein